MFRPIGFWVRLLDSLIEADLDGALTACGLDRRAWQILNLIVVAPRTARQVADDLGPFLESEQEATARLEVLVESGSITVAQDRFEMTSAGREQFDRANHLVGASRDRIASGVSDRAYATTIDTLSAMCRNLGWEEA